MLKSIARALVIMLIASFVISTSAYASEKPSIVSNGVKLYRLQSNQVSGMVRLEGESTRSKIKLYVVRNTKTIWYDVNLVDGRFSEEIYLTDGLGSYTIMVLVHEYDRKYSLGPQVAVQNIKEVNQYLVPEKHIESSSNEIMELAKAITLNSKTDYEKAKAIYDWVASNINYDYEKFKKQQENNYDNVYGALNTLSTKLGVCYDYAALTAALGRASGLQTKLVKGEGRIEGFTGYHAWNEVFVSEQNRWVKLDATFAATSGKNYFDTKNFDESHIKQD